MSPIEMHMRFTAVWALLWARQNACQLRKFCTFGMQFLGSAHRTVMQHTQALACQVICPIACNLAWTCRLHGLVPQMSCGTHLHYHGLIPVILFQQLYAWALNAHGTGKLQVVFRQTDRATSYFEHHGLHPWCSYVKADHVQPVLNNIIIYNCTNLQACNIYCAIAHMHEKCTCS